MTEANKIAAALQQRVQLSDVDKLYAVVDACQAVDLIKWSTATLQQPARMLFKGKASICQGMDAVAPYFISIEHREKFIDAWGGVWRKNAGLLAVSSSDARLVFRHLRNIFVVQDEGGQEYFFRFYDPRVLSTYLPTCSASELHEFFGPIHRIVVADREGDNAAVYSLVDDCLTVDRFAVCEPQPLATAKPLSPFDTEPVSI